MAAVDEVADELYGLLPGEFIAARDAAAKAAKGEGDRDGAAAITALRKPTTTAWLVNMLMRDDPDLPDRLRALGEGLREAESSLAGSELTALDKQRRQLVAGLVKTVKGLAHGVGHRVTPDTADEVSQTLLAALADPDVAEDVLSGQLTQARTHVGFGAGRGVGRSHLGLVPPLDDDGRAASRSGASQAGKSATKSSSASKTSDKSAKADEARKAQEARDAERERRAAERRKAAAEALEQAETEHAGAVKLAREAERVLSRSQATLGERTAATERLEDELEDLTRQLEKSRTAEKEAKAKVAEHQDQHARATKALKWAARDLDSAKADVDRYS